MALSDLAPELTAWGWLAYQEDEELRTQIEPVGWLPAREVEIKLGQPRTRLGTVTLPFSWKAVGPDLHFTILEGDLIVQGVGLGLTQITLQGSYKAPPRDVGKIVDRALFHRLAEACVKNFMDRIRDAIDLGGRRIEIATPSTVTQTI